MNASTILFGTICLTGAAVYIFAGWTGGRLVAVLGKASASTSFVVLAVINGAAGTVYGRAILMALAFSWVGDMLLLSLQKPFLLAGIAVFFVAHFAFAAAFAMNGVSLLATAVALLAASAFAALIFQWLWKYLDGFYKTAVSLYVAAVMIMVSLAVGTSAESMPVTVAVGAVAFALSDVSVARDRFVERNVANKAWGLPLYYLAQVLFAASVITGVG